MTLRPGPPGTWLVGHAGTTSPVPARKGMTHLHLLLSRPGNGIDALTLAGGAVAENDLGPRADATALAAYRRRLRQLDEALDAADATGDATGAETLVAERAALLAEVSAATRLGGRARHIGGSAERARVTVRKAIATAIDTITDCRSRRRPPPRNPHPDRLHLQLRDRSRPAGDLGALTLS